MKKTSTRKKPAAKNTKKRTPKVKEQELMPTADGARRVKRGDRIFKEVPGLVRSDGTPFWMDVTPQVGWPGAEIPVADKKKVTKKLPKPKVVVTVDELLKEAFESAAPPQHFPPSEEVRAVADELMKTDPLLSPKVEAPRPDPAQLQVAVEALVADIEKTVEQRLTRPSFWKRTWAWIKGLFGTSN